MLVSSRRRGPPKAKKVSLVSFASEAVSQSVSNLWPVHLSPSPYHTARHLGTALHYVSLQPNCSVSSTRLQRGRWPQSR